MNEGIIAEAMGLGKSGQEVLSYNILTQHDLLWYYFVK